MTPTSTRTRFFEPDALRFLRDLARHNDRVWFQENKARYESSIQGPALRFIEAAAPRLARLSPHLTADARPFGGSLSRIYRDTRFSKDKSPYKTHLGIHFSHDQATKDENLPGVFFHIAPGESMIATGIWHPTPPALTKIRDAIVAAPADWARAVGKGITIDGESFVKVPSGYPADHPYAVDLRRKDFYASLPVEDAVVSGPDLLTRFEATCRRLDPLNVFLAGALKIPW
ncbi:MAG: DUF2461 domain-containing protein [Thermoplasmata archaeon]|nr:DUF2461 domain-containing protein [Thermoplasmata archaeon]MCI4359709.1 DUF2461 domain-containing protein [Thermoplasmata archaeon]